MVSENTLIEMLDELVSLSVSVGKNEFHWDEQRRAAAVADSEVIVALRHHIMELFKQRG